jgi:DNA polymerase-3 subunit gamma/tau
MLLKGLFEVRDATRPIQALEMVLIRLAYASDLPPTDKLVRDLLDNGGAPAPRGPAPARPSGGGGATAVSGAALKAQPQSQAEPTASFRSLEEIVARCEPMSRLKIDLEHNVHLVRLEPGRIELRPTPRAPSSLAHDLAQKLNAWTGTRWTVTIARDGGAPTLAEQKKAAKAARFESVAQQPLVRAVLDRFAGAEVVAVRDIETESHTPAAPEDEG